LQQVFGFEEKQTWCEVVWPFVSVGTFPLLKFFESEHSMVSIYMELVKFTWNW